MYPLATKLVNGHIKLQSNGQQYGD